MKQVDLKEQMRLRYEQRLRKVLKIHDYLEYNKDPEFGEIGSWAIKSKRGIDDAIKVLIEKSAPIYIHHLYGSASFKWDYFEQHFVCQLWANEQMLEETITENADDLRKTMIRFWSFCRYKKKQEVK
jgi:hypothetical protein